ncbi:unnamed protein product, partial [Ectocarpus fasciculatus]
MLASVRARSCHVSVAANNHEGCPGGSPTRWVNERKVYHERNLPDRGTLIELPCFFTGLGDVFYPPGNVYRGGLVLSAAIFLLVETASISCS